MIHSIFRMLRLGSYNQPGSGYIEFQLILDIETETSELTEVRKGEKALW